MKEGPSHGWDDVTKMYFEPFQVQWSLNVPLGLKLKILRSAHTVCLCSFVWASEQTAIISLNITDLLVFITETECSLRGTD